MRWSRLVAAVLACASPALAIPDLAVVDVDGTEHTVTGFERAFHEARLLACIHEISQNKNLVVNARLGEEEVGGK